MLLVLVGSPFLPTGERRGRSNTSGESLCFQGLAVLLTTFGYMEHQSMDLSDRSLFVIHHVLFVSRSTAVRMYPNLRTILLADHRKAPTSLGYSHQDTSLVRTESSAKALEY